MAERRDRIFALSGAIFFFITSFGLSGMVIWQMVQARGNNASQNSGAGTTSVSSSQSKGKTLQGTKLSNFTPISHVAALQEIDLVKGTGQVVKPGDTVTVNYTGAVAATGIIFQSSADTGNPVTFSLNQVIKGWTEGIPGMKVGGTRRLLIPAALAYGANPPTGSGIPANADLVFDVQLLKIGK